MRKLSRAQKLVSLWFVLSLLCIVLKLAGVVTWPWFLLLLPLWFLPFAIGVFFLILLVGVWFYDL